MSQPIPKPDFHGSLPKRETRRISAVHGAAGGLGGVGGTVDPAQEITHLIAQLQATAQTAQEQLAAVERERDELQAQLEEVSARFHELSSKEEESQARFVEVTSVIRERDELLESVELHTKSIAELQRRIDAMQRQELDLQRQRGATILERERAVQERDAALQQRDAIAAEREELRAKLADAQKQAASLRQARDASQAQCHELIDKVQHLEDQLHEVTHERDTARRQSGDSAESQRLRDEAIRERNQLAERLDQAMREAEAERRRAEENAQSGELARSQEKIAELTRELDAVREALREANAASERATAPGHSEREAELSAQLAALQKHREELLASLTAAQKQIEHIIRDRDQVRQRGIERTIELENQCAEAAAKAAEAAAKAAEAEQQAADAQRRLAAAAREQDSALEKARNFDEQRLAAIDLAAQLDGARREIKQLTAALAEARLEAKAVHRAPIAKTPPPLPARDPAPAAAPAAANPARPNPAPELDDDVLTEKDAKALLTEIKRCYSSFTKTPADFSLLNEIHCQLQHFAERARVSGFLALHRLGRAFDQLAQDLYRFPEQVNPSTVRTIGQTIDLLGTLLKQKNYAALKDPAKATVFAVDDDADNCEAIRMAMESIGMRTRWAQEPAVALAEISSDAYDLVFLDVALPHMDGFELCQHIRALPGHTRTPIVFLTGLTTIENRVQSSLSGGNDFIGKPFNLHELGVKAISLVLKAALHME